MSQITKQEIDYAQIDGVIPNPANPHHFMSIQPVGSLVKIFVVDELVATSKDAVWVLEVGKSMYPPRLYVPKNDIRQSLLKTDKTTHCPLKGDASYYSFMGNEIAWGYEQHLDFAEELGELVAFWPDKVRIEIGV
ncbi:DUF427 domain-containing protein [Maritalea sp.]|uniref:DUF427 domain-containing protein n=1 Tax=Maritalea sp. TaxID=2003361 RepID=UPI003EF73DAC